MDSQDLSWLAAKEKRIKTWGNYLKNEIVDPKIAGETEKALKLFSEKLLQIWDKNNFVQEDKAEIEDLERILEQLNEEARLYTLPKQL